MQPFIFDPWLWRDPAILAGGYRGAAADEGPTEQRREAETDEGGPGTEIDLVGYEVAATDGDIGSIEEAPPDVGHLIVDTGPWIFGRRVLLPVGTVTHVDHLNRTVHVDRTRDQVKEAPAYNPDTGAAVDFRKQVGDYYTASYRDGGPVGGA
ncbi:PRC-barrel domain-containing protein [Polymorphospora rubra]|uniref:PRC-barrel domain-containing protein n=1 Tax=Polymorphospora rubra TaxID=338584 RepID=UPI0033FE4E2D